MKRMNQVKVGNLLDYNNIGNLGKACNRYCKQINISEKSYSARIFRKTFITIARRCRMAASVVAELVGHAHTTTSDRFYNRIDIELMKEELNKYVRPVNKEQNIHQNSFKTEVQTEVQIRVS